MQRARLGLTQEQAAESSAMSAVYFKSLERGTATNPTVRALVSLAQAFGVTPADLLVDRPRPAPRPPGRPVQTDTARAHDKDREEPTSVRRRWRT